jgi:phenylpropionate dioxygenase-like ring-hydroxylating dioxygenase large terminal subunit
VAAPSIPIVRDQWYVAAYGSEVTRRFLARTICNEPIVFYRTADGAPVALADRCVHRRYPLSLSRLDGDRIVCGYHGFTYEPNGSCAFVPGQERIPRTARVTAYPVVEQDSFIWVFIGDPRLAEQRPVPRAPWLNPGSGYETVSGLEPIRCRYSLLVDNLLDLSHETYLHGGYIGTPEVAQTPIETRVDEENNVVHVSRHMDDAECPPFYANSTGLSGRITRWQDVEYHAPCLYLLHSRVAPVGSTPNPDGSDPGAFHTEITYAITPETDHSVLDFWMVSRDFALGDAEVTEYLAKNNHTVVMQDVDALNILEEVIAAEPEGFQELSINIDAGGLAARRVLKNMAQAVAVASGEAGAA